MARYIDADDLRRRVKTATNPYGKPSLEYESGVKVLKMIDEQPTIESAPKSEGEWVVTYNNGVWYYDCPFCDDGYAQEAKLPASNYCANCGAKLHEPPKMSIPEEAAP